MKKVLKVIGLVLLFFIIAYGVVYLMFNEKLPEGKEGKEAEELAQDILESINHAEFKKTKFLEWSFRGEHYYKWDKENHVVDIKWGDNHLILKPNTPNESIVKLPLDLSDTEKSSLIELGLKYFNNDSFWLVAPHKIMDDGTERSVVNQDGKKSLLVTYTSGGDTPGDSYLWSMDSTGKPESFKMWVEILPLGGVDATWDAWVKTESGTYLPSSHELVIGKLGMGEVKGF